MDAGVVAVLAALVGFAALWAVAIAGTVDAMSQPPAVWARAGVRRRWWVAQALGVLVPPAVFVYSGLYYTRVRPKLIAAARELAVEQRPRPVRAAAVQGRVSIRMAPSVAAAISSGVIVGYLIAASIVRAHYVEALISGSFATLIVFALNSALRVTLTPDELVIRVFRRRRVPWSDVVAISPMSSFGARYVRVWTRIGTGERLRVPVTFFALGRARFERDLAKIVQWWSAG